MKIKTTIFSLFNLVMVLFISISIGYAAPTPLIFNHVSLSADFFNPANGEEISIFFHLSAPAHVSCMIYDRYGNLVRIVEERYEAQKGSNKLSWDGRQNDSTIVPDEAYTFIIEAEGENGEKAIYNPTREYGEEVKITKQQAHHKDGTFTYTVPVAARVLVRVGIANNGPLYRTLVNWEPRCAGVNTEYWDGWDESKTENLADDKDVIASYQAYTLPENVIITKGNPVNIRTIEKQSLFKTEQSQVNPDGTRQINVASIYAPQERSSHVDPELILARDIDIEFSVSSVKSENFISATRTYTINAPAQKNLITQVNLPESEMPLIDQERFELLFFIDKNFVYEEEAGTSVPYEEAQISLPYEYTWDISNLAQGPHILTVNIVGLKGHLGTSSIKLLIQE